MNEQTLATMRRCGGFNAGSLTATSFPSVSDIPGTSTIEDVAPIRR